MVKGLPTIVKEIGIGKSLLIFAVTNSLLFLADKQERIIEGIYNQVVIAANTNFDNLTSHEEWASVYEALDRPYSIHTSNPSKDLSPNDLRNYLESTK